MSYSAAAGTISGYLPYYGMTISVDRIDPQQIVTVQLEAPSSNSREETLGKLGIETGGHAVVPEWLARWLCAVDNARVQPLANLEASAALLDSGLDDLRSPAVDTAGVALPYLTTIVEAADISGQVTFDIAKLAQMATRIFGEALPSSVLECARLVELPKTVPEDWPAQSRREPRAAPLSLSLLGTGGRSTTYDIGDADAMPDMAVVLTVPAGLCEASARREGLSVVVDVRPTVLLEQRCFRLWARLVRGPNTLDQRRVHFPRPGEPGYALLLPPSGDTEDVRVEITVDPTLPADVARFSAVRHARQISARWVQRIRFGVSGDAHANRFGVSQAWRDARQEDLADAIDQLDEADVWTHESIRYSAEVGEAIASYLNDAGDLPDADAAMRLALVAGDTEAMAMAVRNGALCSELESSQLRRVVTVLLRRPAGPKGEALVDRYIRTVDGGTDGRVEVLPDEARNLGEALQMLDDMEHDDAVAGEPYESGSLLSRLAADVPGFIRACTPSVMLDQLPAGFDLLRSDVSVSFAGLGSPLSANGPFADANAAVSRLYGARRAWSFTNGSTGANWVIARTIAARRPKHPVLISRGSHISVPQALDDFGVDWGYIGGSYDAVFEAVLPTTLDALEAALQHTAKASAVWLVGPTYEGALLDTLGVRAFLDERESDAWLIVDEAWGSHFPAHSSFVSAASCGADLVSTSAHKQAGALQGAAVLVTPEDSKVSDAWIASSMRALASTSPPFHILGSIEATYATLLHEGEQRLDRLIAMSEAFGARVDAIGCGLRQFARDSGVDPLKSTWRLQEGTLTGFQLADELAKESVIVEKAGLNTVTFLFTMQMAENDVGAMAGALATVLRRSAGDAGSARTQLPDPFTFEEARSAKGRAKRLKRVRKSECVRIAIGEAEGRIAAERLAVYPPGVPVLFEGQRISSTHISYLDAVALAGGHFATNSGYESEDGDLYISVTVEPT